jgi:hypothetical protein
MPNPTDSSGHESHATDWIAWVIKVTALVATIVFSLYFSAGRLSTKRPVVPPGYPMQNSGPQGFESRLWEDPLRVDRRPADKGPDPLNLSAFTNAIHTMVGTNTHLVTLAVMVGGGHYAEDREHRVRTRYAVVSGLLVSGYKPDDAEHIGAATFPWPTDLTWERVWKANRESSLDQLATATTETNGLDRFPASFGFEVFKPREFRPGSQQPLPDLLVLWIPTELFEDLAPVRLAVFSHLLGPAGRDIRIVGPSRSSALRALCKTADLGDAWTKTKDGPQAFLKEHVSIHLAVTTAADAFLVPPPNSLSNTTTRRKLVIDHLTNIIGLRGATNLSVPDDELATSIFRELELRRRDPHNPKNHVVLIAEQDTFYGRLMSTTYGLELNRPTTQPFQSALAGFMSNSGSLPKHFRVHHYLRGLDGLRPDDSRASEAATASSRGRDSAASPLERWVNLAGESNQAEGRNQYDYLVRLSWTLEALEAELAGKRDHISAIGIVGADVYDKLLILRALRNQFPQAVFFTTELDARLWHPEELPHSRNLIVASGYGLSLHPKHASGVPPFRDSQQTAVFAAVRHAVDPGFGPPLDTPARVFEIGRGGPIDLSRSSDLSPSAEAKGPLHPDTRGTKGPGWTRVAWGIVAFIAAAVLLVWKCRPIHRWTVAYGTTELEALLYQIEDFGGDRGLSLLIDALYQSKDPLPEWLRSEMERHVDTDGIAALRGLATTPLNPAPANGPTSGAYLEHLAAQDAVQDVVAFFNLILCGKVGWPSESICKTAAAWPPTDASETIRIARRHLEHRTRQAPERGLPTAEVRFRRHQLNKLLAWLGAKRTDAAPDADAERAMMEGPVDEWQAAEEARKATNYWINLRQRLLNLFVGLGGIWFFVVVIVVYLAYRDTFNIADGEPFTLTTGTSVWPTEFLRLLTAGVGGALLLVAYRSLQDMTVRISRKYCLSFHRHRPRRRKDSDEEPPPWMSPSHSIPMRRVSGERVRANALWYGYQLRDGFWSRFRRVLVPSLLFGGFGIALLLAGEFPKSPVRGAVSFYIDVGLLFITVGLGVVITFWTIDAAQLARWLIEHLSEAPTKYPKATLDREKRRWGDVVVGLDEVLDTELIADLTETVGKLVYFPAVIFLLMLLARDSWWDRWAWPPGLLIMFVVSFGLSAVSVIIVQQSARKARQRSIQRLEERQQEWQSRQRSTPEADAPTQMDRMLQRLRHLERGAFVPFYANPVWSALAIPWGGSALFDILSHVLPR